MFGYKVLEWTDNKLISPMYKAEWKFGTKAVAECGWMGHPAPQDDCKCGIYATKDSLACTPYMRGIPHVLALGWASGKTVIGEKGYRCAEWEPVYMVDISALEAESDAMWDAAYRGNRGGDVQLEVTLYILGLEGAKKRSRECFEINRKLRADLSLLYGADVIDLEQAEKLVGDSWAGK